MATTKRARSQPEISKQGAKEPAAHKSARIHPLRGELPLSERYAAGKAHFRCRPREIGRAIRRIPERWSW